MSRKLMASFTNFNRGINTTASYDELEESELIAGYNIDLEARGGYKKRLGCSFYSARRGWLMTPMGLPITRVITYPGELLILCDKELTNQYASVTYGTLGSENISYQFFTNSKLYIVDGSKYWVFDGSACVEVTPAVGSDLTPIKRCTKILQRGQRLFAIGDPQFPNYLYFSEIGDPSNFQPSSIFNAVTDDTDTLITLALFSDSLLAFKRDEIFRWSGWDPTADVVFSPLDVGHGAISPDAVQVSEDLLIFVDSDGVYCLSTIEDSLIKSYKISRNIDGIFQTLTNLDKVKTFIYKGNFYMSCCNDSTGVNNLVLKAYLNMPFNSSNSDTINMLSFPWVVYTGWNVAEWFTIDNELYYGSSVNSCLYKALDGMNDEILGTTEEIPTEYPVEMEVIHYLKLGEAAIRNKLKKLFLIAKQEEDDLQATVRLDIEMGYEGTISKLVQLGDSATWDQSNWDEVSWDWTDTLIKEIRVGKNLSRLKVKITHDRLSELLTIYGFSAFYKSKKPRGSRDGISDI